MDRYEELKRRYAAAITDLSILAGDIVGPSDASWQDVAGTAAVNLQMLAKLLHVLREGGDHWQGCPLNGTIVFPSVRDFLDE